MKKRFEKYLDKSFKNVKNIPEINELKKEILNDLLDRYEDIKKDSLSDDDVFENCINSLGDLKSLIKEYKKEHNKFSDKVDLPKYKLSEELMNAISHGVGVLLSIAALVLCIIKSDSGLDLFSSLFYGISSIVLYLMSCLYHSLPRNNSKRIFRIFDHCSIFLLIAGTYTPCALLMLPGFYKWIIFGFVWACAVIGIILNSIDLRKFKKFSMILYLVMGWCVIFCVKPLWTNMNHNGIYLLLLGGVIYTIGAILCGIGKKRVYMHSIFHFFCILASVSFFFAIYLYAL